MAGGDIDRAAIAEAFLKIKEDIVKINKELAQIKEDQKKPVNPGQIDADLIRQIVKETLKSLPQKKESAFVRKINKKRKSLLISRILNLAEKKNMTLPEIKEVVVDSENLCSKATFYRYMETLKSRGRIDLIKINETDVVVKQEN